MPGKPTWSRTMSTRKIFLCILISTSCFQASAQEETTPTSLPDQPSPNAGAIFVQDLLSNYFVSRNRSAELLCSARNVDSLTIQCHGSELSSGQISSDVISFTSTTSGGEETGLRVKTNITDEIIKSVFADYFCKCVAVPTGMTDRVQGTSARIRIANLKSYFQSQPFEQSDVRGSNVVMQCTLPDGKPSPIVRWERDGHVINPVSTNGKYTVDSNSWLIIANIDYTDMGNYTCVADNGFQVRRTQPASLYVYENGGWSTWGGWLACNTECGTGTMSRQRFCNNPRPRGRDAKNCTGENLQSSRCTKQCGPVVVRSWSNWEEWGPCEAIIDCRRYRYRTCMNPEPNRDGLQCQGSHVQTQNCSLTQCTHGAVIKGEGTGTQQDSQNILLWVILCAAVAVFAVILVIIIMCLMKRRNQAPSTQGMCDSEASSHDDNAAIRRNQPQDKFHIPHANGGECIPMIEGGNKIIRGAVIPGQPPFALSPNQQNQTAPYRFSNLDMRPDHNRYMQISPPEPCDTHDYMQIGSTGNPVRSDSDSTDEADKMSQRSSSGPESGICNSVCGDDRQSLQQEWSYNSPLQTQALIDYRGLRLKVPNSAISLMVPEGAVPRTVENQQVVIGSLCDRNEKPPLLDKQTMLSSVVFAGPQNVHFNKSLVLSFDHCASLKLGQYAEGSYCNWKLSIYGNTSENGDENNWKRIITLNQEVLHTPIYCQLDLSRCHLMVDQLASRYCLVGESMYGNKAVKILRLAAFAQPIYSNMATSYTVRVYILSDTQDTLNTVIHEESRLGATLVAKTRQISFQDGGNGLCLVIDSVSSGWYSKQSAQYVEIPFRHVWNGQNRLHCSLTFDKQGQTTPHAEFLCKLQVYQKSVLSNRQHLSISSSNTLTDIPGKDLSSTVTVNTQSSSGCSTMLTGNTIEHRQFRLPTSSKKRLASHLDTPCTRGNDWRLLAAALNSDRQLNFFASKPSPTEALLDLWEAREGSERCATATDLLNILKAMGRNDAAQVLESDIDANRVWV